MVPKVAGKGRSVKGAGLYYLHDKKALTRERVAFTHTENLPTRDPDKAIKCMAWTALRANEIKARSGASTKGRKMTDPVYCYSLSWAPGEEPSQAQMIEAAKDSLKALRLEHHEALFVGHNDEPHPHIHVVVNRVNPETGIAAPLKMDFLKLSTWAEEFEKRQGQIRCKQRVENNERRRYGEFVKDYDSQHAAEFRRWRQERRERRQASRDFDNAALEVKHDRQYDALCDDRDRRIDAKRQQVRDATRQDWRRLFRSQFEEKRRFSGAQQNSWTRLRYFVRTHAKEFSAADRNGRIKLLKSAFSALLGSKRQYAELVARQLAARKAHAGKIKGRTEQLTRSIKEDHARKLVELRNQHGKERIELNKRHARDREQQAKEIKEGRDRKVFQAKKDTERKRELAEQKQDMTKPPTRAPDNSLKAKFREARGQSKREIDQPQTTHKRGKLSEQFRQAKESVEKTKLETFKDNTNDLATDKGREQSRKPKPPGPRKPD